MDSLPVYLVGVFLMPRALKKIVPLPSSSTRRPGPDRRNRAPTSAWGARHGKVFDVGWPAPGEPGREPDFSPWNLRDLAAVWRLNYSVLSPVKQIVFESAVGITCAALKPGSLQVGAALVSCRREAVKPHCFIAWDLLSFQTSVRQQMSTELAQHLSLPLNSRPCTKLFRSCSQFSSYNA